MNLENIILSERNQPQRPHIVGFQEYEMSRIGQYIKVYSSFMGLGTGVGGEGWRKIGHKC